MEKERPLMNSPVEVLKTRLSPPRRMARDIARMLWLSRHGFRFAAKLASNRIFYRYGCCISPNADIASDVIFPHPNGIVIGEGVRVGPGCTIFQQVTLGQKGGGYPSLGASCTLYAGSSVLGEVALAERVTVGASALVMKSCEIPGAVLVGSPARALAPSS